MDGEEDEGQERGREERRRRRERRMQEQEQEEEQEHEELVELAGHVEDRGKCGERGKRENPGMFS